MSSIKGQSFKKLNVVFFMISTNSIEFIFSQTWQVERKMFDFPINQSAKLDFLASISQARFSALNQPSSNFWLTTE